jgi:hypothetical protein
MTKSELIDQLTMKLIILLFTLLLSSVIIQAGEVNIVSAEFIKNSNNRWNIDVTLKHNE